MGMAEIWAITMALITVVSGVVFGYFFIRARWRN